MAAAAPTDLHICNPGKCSSWSDMMAVVVPSVIAVAISAKHHCQAQSMLENYTNLCITNWEMKLTRAARHFLWCLWLSCFAWREKSILLCIASYLWMWWVKKREVCHSSTCWLQLQLFQITWAGGTKQLNNLISTFPTRHTIQWSSLSLKHSEKSKIWAIRTGKYCKNLQACYTTVKQKRPYNRRQFKYCVRRQTWQLHYIIVLNIHVQHCNQCVHQLYCKRLATLPCLNVKSAARVVMCLHAKVPTVVSQSRAILWN